MTRRFSCRTLVVTTIALALVVVVGLIAVGCSGSSKSSSTTAGAGTSTAAKGSTTSSSKGGSQAKTGTTAAGKTGGAQSTTTSVPLRVGAKSTAQYQAEIPKLQQTLKANPNDLASLQELALAQYSLGDFADAAATYEKMLAIKDDPTTRNNYGNVLRDGGNLAEAITQYHKAIAGDKTLINAYVNLAGIYVGQKKLADAKVIVQQGITATTGNNQALLKSYLAELNKK